MHAPGIISRFSADHNIPGGVSPAIGHRHHVRRPPLQRRSSIPAHISRDQRYQECVCSSQVCFSAIPGFWSSGIVFFLGSKAYCGIGSSLAIFTSMPNIRVNSFCRKTRTSFGWSQMERLKGIGFYVLLQTSSFYCISFSILLYIHCEFLLYPTMIK